MIIFIFIAFFFSLKKYFKSHGDQKFFHNKENIVFSKFNLNKWMSLSKKERYDLSKKESISYLNKRKVLLDEIRKEYKKISKDNIKKLNNK